MIGIKEIYEQKYDKNWLKEEIPEKEKESVAAFLLCLKDINDNFGVPIPKFIKKLIIEEAFPKKIFFDIVDHKMDKHTKLGSSHYQASFPLDLGIQDYNIFTSLIVTKGAHKDNILKTMSKVYFCPNKEEMRLATLLAITQKKKKEHAKGFSYFFHLLFPDGQVIEVQRTCITPASGNNSLLEKSEVDDAFKKLEEILSKMKKKEEKLGKTKKGNNDFFEIEQETLDFPPHVLTSLNKVLDEEKKVNTNIKKLSKKVEEVGKKYEETSGSISQLKERIEEVLIYLKEHSEMITKLQSGIEKTTSQQDTNSPQSEHDPKSVENRKARKHKKKNKEGKVSNDLSSSQSEDDSNSVENRKKHKKTMKRKHNKDLSSSQSEDDSKSVENRKKYRKRQKRNHNKDSNSSPQSEDCASIEKNKEKKSRRKGGNKNQF